MSLMISDFERLMWSFTPSKTFILFLLICLRKLEICITCSIVSIWETSYQIEIIQDWGYPHFNARIFVVFMYPAGRALSSDWSVNSFIMVTDVKMFSLAMNRKFWLTDNLYKTTEGPVRTKCSSYRVLCERLRSSHHKHLNKKSMKLFLAKLKTLMEGVGGNTTLGVVCSLSYYISNFRNYHNKDNSLQNSAHDT